MGIIVGQQDLIMSRSLGRVGFFNLLINESKDITNQHMNDIAFFPVQSTNEIQDSVQLCHKLV